MEKEKKTIAAGEDTAPVQSAPVTEDFALYDELPVASAADETAKEIAERMAEDNAVDSGLKVLRVKRKRRDGQGEYFTYQVLGKLRGAEQHVSMVPPDRGGYSVLAMVFGEATAVPLLLVPYEMQDARGQTVRGNTYMVRTIDENGIKYECKLKPQQDSDKRVLDCFLQLAATRRQA